jgi:hypothetical protein
MAAPFLFTAARPASSLIESSRYVCQACQRNKSTYRRMKKALRVKPDPAFVPSKTEPQDHIIFNPPSSAPNVYHTPPKFLPASDPRRRLHSLAARPIPASDASQDDQQSLASLLRPIRTQQEKKYHLGKDEIEEIRRLRAEDPKLWTRVRLAEKFECSQFFISLCCSAPEIKKQQDKQLEAIKKRWGRKKTEAREERQARKALWGRDS